MIEFVAGILTTIVVASLAATFLYWIALDWFKDVPEAQAYVDLVNRGLIVLAIRQTVRKE